MVTKNAVFMRAVAFRKRLKDIYKREGGHEYVLGRINTCTCHYIFGGT